MIAAFADEPAAVPTQVPQQITSFHEAALWAVTLTRVVAVSKR
jgi:hypothetical protein